MQELTLSELNQQIKKTLEEQLERSYWVIAEIGQIQINQSGHCYLELVQKENNQVVAKAKATIWAYAYRNISAWFERIAGSELTMGMKILANATVNFHEVYGLSLNIKDIDPSYTLGEREKARQGVIRKLEQDGIMDMNKGLPLPIVPQKIAIISAETAAGYGDFINQLENNLYGYKIHHRLYQSVMQGVKAAESIVEALHQIHSNNSVDLVVIIRGGGSQLDLDCFDDYELCSHIAQFPLPILTGIGHERDTTIADMVAHTQLKTPTAVAEFLLQGFMSFQAQVEDYFNSIRTSTLGRLGVEKEVIYTIQSGIKHYAELQIHRQDTLLNSLTQSIKHITRAQIKAAKNSLSTLEQKIDLINPKHILQKGYAIVYKNGKPIGDKTVASGDTLETVTARQKIKSTVNTTTSLKNL
ncbi:MAG: exodeoxyribonuclease VII large subunit [Cyclobacteriaceae bacterium]|nr:exodeoxyribonuclease VII large subunit [Cyclobacteriaceae bacterium]